MARNATDTRARLLHSARKQFALNGFERTTVRAIASEAGVNAAMVMRYFGSKEGIFAEAAEIDLALPKIDAGAPRGEAGTALIRHFLKRWEGPESDDLLRVLIRSAATNDAARDRMRSILDGQVMTMIGELVEDKTSVPARAGLVATQILGLAFCRYVLELTRPDLTDETTIRILGATIDRYVFEAL